MKPACRHDIRSAHNTPETGGNSYENKSIFNSIIRKLKSVEGINVLDVSHASKKNITSGTKNIEINYYYTEISKKGVDKWTAIEFLINKLNITRE